MTTASDESVKLLILTVIKRKEVVSSSYFIHQFLTMLGVFNSAEQLLLSYETEELISHEGKFEGKSELLKNIGLTNRGLAYVKEHSTHEAVHHIKAQFGDSGLVNSLFAV